MIFQRDIGIFLVLFITFSSTIVIASRLRLRPLSAKEVYQILKDAGREDAIPEGRTVTQGISAISGFALGLKSGVAIPLAIGVATSNATQQFLNNINYTAIMSSLPTIPTITLPNFNVSAITSNIPTINMTALANLFKHDSTNSASVQYTTQEICFSSRNLNEINDSDDGENSDNADDDNDDNDDYDDGDIVAGRQATGTAPTGVTAADTPGTAEETGTGSVSTTNDGEGSGTFTQTTTNTGNGGSVNCIVIQKPVVG